MEPNAPIPAKQFEKMLRTKRVVLTWDQFFIHYFLVIIGFIGMAIVSYIFINDIGRTTPHYRFKFEFLIPTFTIVIALFIFQFKALKFTIIPTELTGQEVMIIIKLTAEENNWILDINRPDYSIAKTRIKLLNQISGERIIILYEKGRILFNNIQDPNLRFSIKSLGRNKKYVRSLITNLNRSYPAPINS